MIEVVERHPWPYRQPIGSRRRWWTGSPTVFRWWFIIGPAARGTHPPRWPLPRPVIESAPRRWTRAELLLGWRISSPIPRPTPAFMRLAIPWSVWRTVQWPARRSIVILRAQQPVPITPVITQKIPATVATIGLLEIADRVPELAQLDAVGVMREAARYAVVEKNGHQPDQQQAG